MDLSNWLIVIGVAIASFIFAPYYVKWLSKKQFGQYIREEGPSSHLKKSGTPTMGGVIFLLPVILFSIIFLRNGSYEFYFLLSLILLYMFIGGIDDYSKVMKKQNEGLTSSQKIIMQIVAAITLYVLFLHKNIDTSIQIPFIHENIQLGWLYSLFVVFLIIGSSNATNLTDGIDGLLTGNSIVTFIAFSIISYIQGNTVIFMVSTMFVATLLVFLIFNFNPAKVFMGDMGSLVLGATMAGMAILLKTEFLLILIGLVYVLETLSVILQVTSVKLTGKKIFKMSPVHHHFELVGYSEKKIFTLFVGIQVVFSIIAITMLVI